MDRKVGIPGLAMTFAGSILGAGYVSGQELFQYFGAYGENGIVGIVISIVLITAFSFLVLWLTEKSKAATYDAVVIRFDNKCLKTVFGIVFTLLYYMVTIVMIAGIVSLSEQLFGISRLPVAVIVTAAVAVIVYFGVDGMVAVFTLSVPILIVAAIIICMIQIFGGGLREIRFTEASVNPLLGGWLFSAVNYAACNGFASAGVLTPLEPRLKNKSAKFLGMIIGAAVLLLIAIAILAALATCPGAVVYDLPMLSVAQTISPAVGYIYGVLLFLAMFGNAVATFVAVMNYLLAKTVYVQRHKPAFIIVIGAVACIAGMTGFSRLVGMVYPVIGYVGILTAVLMIEHAMHLRK